MRQSKNDLPGQNQEDKDSSVMQCSDPLVNYAACLYFSSLPLNNRAHHLIDLSSKFQLDSFYKLVLAEGP